MCVCVCVCVCACVRVSVQTSEWLRAHASDRTSVGARACVRVRCEERGASYAKLSTWLKVCVLLSWRLYMWKERSSKFVMHF